MKTMNEKAALITGGSGKTGKRMAERLQELQYPVRIASRNRSLPAADGIEHVPFDWYDESTHAAALENTDRVYLVAPVLDANPIAVMLPFIKKALELGVKRFVLLGSASIPEDGPVFGPVHQALRRLAPEWAVLQPSYFMQNFTEGPHGGTIRSQSAIYSAAGEGRLGFVSADDIAEVGVRALIDEVPHNTAHLITGPESLSYGEAARRIGSVLGREIRHVSLTDDELLAGMIQAGMPRDYAVILAGLDQGIREQGTEDLSTDTVERVTGRRPISLEAFIQQHAGMY